MVVEIMDPVGFFCLCFACTLAMIVLDNTKPPAD
jgi:hypothetical protein